MERGFGERENCFIVQETCGLGISVSLHRTNCDLAVIGAEVVDAKGIMRIN